MGDDQLWSSIKHVSVTEPQRTFTGEKLISDIS
jgi:hypothetical protein